MAAPRAGPEDAMDDFVTERSNRDAAYGFRASRCRERRRTPYQSLEMYDTPQFGRVLRLYGCYMTSEREEFFYHEAFVHPAAVAHPAPRSALVVGGGDRAAAASERDQGLRRRVGRRGRRGVPALACGGTRRGGRRPEAGTRVEDGFAYVNETTATIPCCST